MHVTEKLYVHAKAAIPCVLQMYAPRFCGMLQWTSQFSHGEPCATALAHQRQAWVESYSEFIKTFMDQSVLCVRALNSDHVLNSVTFDEQNNSTSAGNKASQPATMQTQPHAVSSMHNIPGRIHVRQTRRLEEDFRHTILQKGTLNFLAPVCCGVIQLDTPISSKECCSWGKNLTFKLDWEGVSISCRSKRQWFNSFESAASTWRGEGGIVHSPWHELRKND